MTSQQQIDRLMMPRYEVIANYPNSPWRLNQVINGQTFNIAGEEKIHCADYPSIFKKLQWWEHRGESEMPQYVKYAATGRVCKVDNFDLETTSSWFMYLENEIHPYCPGGTALDGTHWLPATETEFLSYINKGK